MKQIEFSDAVAISGTRTTNDGYLVADCRVARTGIQEYMGYELGDGKDASKVYRIYRPEDEVFKKDALQSYAYRPITLGHPPEGGDSRQLEERGDRHCWRRCCPRR